MELELIKKKWEGVQSVWKDGCYFFSLMTIADELDIKYDLVHFTKFCLNQNLITADGTIRDAEELLYALTGRRFKRTIVKELPVMKQNMYSIEKWYNERTGFTHFRRRFVDTLVDSVTVKEGKLIGYYIFTEVS